SADIALSDEAGEPIGELSDCWFRRVELTRRGAPEDSALRVDLVPAPLAADPSPAVLGRIDDIIKHLSGVPEDTAARHRENALLLDALIASVARQSVLAVVDPEVSFTVDEVVAAGAIAPESAGLLGYLLRL